MRTQKRRNFGRICICHAVDPEGNQLGWAVCVMILDTDPVSEEPSNANGSPRAEYLALRHCALKAEANACKQGILDFFCDERGFVERFASIYEFWELNAVKQASDEFLWTILEGQALADIQANEYTLVYKPEDWHPDEPDSLSAWIERYCR